MTKFLTWTLVATLAVAWFLTLHPVELGGRASYVLVSGSSMQPTLKTGDLVITRRQSSYKVGDVVTFRVNDAKVIHRIIGGNGTDGYTLQGDNNPRRDPWFPTDDQIAGKQWIYVPGGAQYLEAVQGPEALGGILTFLITVGLISHGKRRPRRRAGEGSFVVRRVSDAG